MKFRNKIIVSFCIIIFVPILSALVTLFSFQKIQLRAIEQTYGVENGDYSYFSNSMQLMSRFTQEVFAELAKVAEDQPEQLEDKEYLDAVNGRLAGKNSCLVIRREDALTYIGLDVGAAVLTELPHYGGAGMEWDANTGIYVDGKEQIGRAHV